MDKTRNLRLYPLEDLKMKLERIGISEGNSIITHCQTHHRSGLTYLIGKALGFNIRAYDGSWSEWGNLEDTPIKSPKDNRNSLMAKMHFLFILLQYLVPQHLLSPD